MSTPVIYQLPTPLAGSVGVLPVQKYMVVGDNLATVTTAGYLNAVNLEGFPVAATDIINTLYSFNPNTKTGTFEQFQVAISNGVITLSALSVAGDVVLPTTANNVAIYTNTTGQLSEVSGGTALINGNLTVLGGVNAGNSTNAGSVIVWPGTANAGAITIEANNNAGNFGIFIQNASFGQASALTIPDPGAAAADFVLAPSALVSGNLVKASGTAGLIVNAGFALHAATTAAYAGGGTSNAFTTTNMTSSSIVTATILSQTNAASIVKAVPGTNTLTVTFSADPGANTTISWISVTPAG